MSVVVLITFAACTPGQAQTSPSPTSSPPPRSPSILATASPTPTPAPQLNVSLSVAYGSIHGRTGEPHCPNWFDHWDNVVLNQSRLTYSAGDLGRMSAWFKSGKTPDYDLLDPSLLAVQPGAPTSAPTGDAAGVAAPFGTAMSCLFSLEITNTGPSAVQIPQAGLRLTGSPVPNPTAYRLVEFCSVVKSASFCGPVGGGSPPPCSVEGVEVALTDGQVGTDIVSPPAQLDPTSHQACPEVTLARNQSVTLVFGAYSSAALIYQAMPVLDVITPTAQGTVTFPQLASVYAFADPAQFTCYKLSGSTFVAWKVGAAAYDFMANQQQNAWCA